MQQIIKATSALPKVTETNELLRSVAKDLRSETNESELKLDELLNGTTGNSSDDSEET